MLPPFVSLSLFFDPSPNPQAMILLRNVTRSALIFRLSFTAGVTVNEEAGKQDSVVEQYLCPRPLPPLVARRASLPSADPTPLESPT